MKVFRTSNFNKKSGRIKRWNNVPGSITIELSFNPVGEPPIYDITFNRPLPESVSREIRGLVPEHGRVELVVNYASSGYDDPGSTYNPDTAYPPEGDNENIVTSVELITESGKRELSPQAMKDLELAYQEEINSEDPTERDEWPPDTDDPW